MNHLDRRDCLNALIDSHHDATTADRQIVEPRTARRERDGRVGDAHIELQKPSRSTATIHAPAKARRKAKQP